MKQRQSWEVFQKTGLLLFINQFLHIFGWAIVIQKATDGTVDVYPARVNWRGFNHEAQGEAYTKLTNHMAESIEELKEDIKD